MERIVSAQPSTHEEGAWAVVDAIAELCERHGARAPSALLGLIVDEEAQRRIAAALGCRVEWVPCLLGAGAHVLGDGTASRERGEQLVALLVPWLQR